MVIKLIKEHILVNDLLPVNHIAEVTDGFGKTLIDKGIAIDVTHKYKKEVKIKIKAETRAKKQSIAKEQAEAELAIQKEADKLTDKK